MLKFVISETQLKKIIDNIILEQEPEGRFGMERYGYNYKKPETLNKAAQKQSQANQDIFNSVKNINQKVFNFFNGLGVLMCIPPTMISFVIYVITTKEDIMSKLGITDKELVMFLKASIGIMGRESSFTMPININNGFLTITPRYVKKQIYNYFSDVKWIVKLGFAGRTGSYGPAQIQLATWNALNLEKLFNMKESEITTKIGAGIATIVNLNNNYKLAKSVGYDTSKSNIASGTGNAALDIAIAGHNIGKPIKWCKTNDKNYAAPCDSKDKKYQPYPKNKPNLILTVSSQQIPNYIPKKTTEKYKSDYNNVPLTTHNYVKEVSGYMSQFTCLDRILNIK